jgi:hypothetical protein
MTKKSDKIMLVQVAYRATLFLLPDLIDSKSEEHREVLLLPQEEKEDMQRV